MKVQEGLKKINGIDIYYKIVGKGEPVVIAHGGPGLGHNYLYPHFKALAKQHQVIFYDQRSSGKTSGHETPLDITIETMVEDLEGLRTALGIVKLNLAGHSWGGLLVLNYAVRYPENLKTLMLLASSGASSEYVPEFNNNLDRRLSADEKKEIVVLAETFRKNADASAFIKYYEKYFQAYFYDKKQSKHLHLDYFDNEMVQKNLIVNEMLSRYFKDYCLFDSLGRITCPVLVMHGDHDPIPFQELKRVSESIKGARFVLLKNSGHFSHMENSDEYFSVLKAFLQKYT